jgi:hypothetical protein
VEFETGGCGNNGRILIVNLGQVAEVSGAAEATGSLVAEFDIVNRRVY